MKQPFRFVKIVFPLALLASSLITLSFNPAFGQEGKNDEADKVVRSQAALSDAVLKTASKIDNFFSNERHFWTSNKTRVTLRGNADWIDHAAGWDFGAEAKIFLALPGLNDRLRIVANDDDEDGSTDSASSEDQDRTLALRWIGSASKKHGVSYDVGVGSRDGKLQPFGRVNLFRHYGLGQSKWDGRTANRLYWYTDAGWRNDFRQYFERRLSDKFFFRSRTRIDYQEDKLDAAYPEQKFTLFHQVSDKIALAYELVGRQYCACDEIYDDNERDVTNTDRYNLAFARVRFRQNVFYPWLFYEVWPTAAFPEELDYRFTAAVRFRLEIVLGDPPEGATKLDE